MAKKTTCPISRPQFREKAPSIVVKIGEQEYTLSPREFGTGSLGWNLSDKLRGVKIDGVEVAVQIGLNLIVVGSKDLPGKQEEGDEAPPADSESAA